MSLIDTPASFKLSVDGREVARGRHADLLADPRYRAIVGRGMEDDE